MLHGKVQPEIPPEHTISTMILDQLRYYLVIYYLVNAKENSIWIYIFHYLWGTCVDNISWACTVRHTVRYRWTDIIMICVNYLCHIHHIRNDKYEWVRVDTIYDQNKIISLCHILHISNDDICGTQHGIVTKFISTMNIVSAYELVSTTNFWMCGKGESVHSTHILIKFNASKNKIMVRGEA